MAHGGDVLARGGKSATFGPAKCSPEKWAAIWQEEDALVQEAEKQSGKNEKLNGKSAKSKPNRSDRTAE